ncbi:MAG: porin family protein [Flavobacteriaceae bacterium]|jgi:hypothetical protein|nr:porin family protein [Flavobacteriaceae bacterium]
MKRNFLILFLLAVSATSFAQVKFGVKGGMAFGYSGSLKQTVTNIKESNAKNSIGWHAGLFGRFTIVKWFIQPEIYFSSMKTDLNSSEGEFSANYNRLDIPVLAGTKILGIGRLYAGPVFSTTLSEKISLKNIRKTDTDNFSLAGQLGAGVDIFSVTFDVRYEFGFNKTQTNFISNNTEKEFKFEKRPNSLLVSVGYKF